MIAPGDLPSTERSLIAQALEKARFNKSKAAKALGLTRQQLYVRDAAARPRSTRLLLAQRLCWIQAQHASRRDVAGDHGNDCESRGNQHQRQGVVG